MGINIDKQLKRYNKIVAIFIFLGMPLLIYFLSDFPRRTFLKESISIITLLALCAMIAQFYLGRSNKNILKAHKMSKVIYLHKFIGYVFICVLIFHPILIVVPRYFESGVDPLDAFITIVTSYHNTGILLGIIAWCLMLILGLTSLLRNWLGLTYKSWRIFHGILSVAFIILASFHAIILGRHTNKPMSVFIIIMVGCGVLLLLNIYFFKSIKIRSKING